MNLILSIKKPEIEQLTCNNQIFYGIIMKIVVNLCDGYLPDLTLRNHTENAIRDELFI